MIVVGGVYREICVDQGIDEIFGSGGRGAAALASTGLSVSLHSPIAASHLQAVRDALEPSGVAIVPFSSESLITFRYLHTLATPTYYPAPSSKGCVTADHERVLLYGMMEADFVVHADDIVWDPQGSNAAPLAASGSSAKRLALVLNSIELGRLAGESNEALAVEKLVNSHAADVIVVKAGAVGARIYECAKLVGEVPPYRSERVYKIGTGDIFTAAFFNGWSILNLNPVEAADYASRSVARYCETRSSSLMAPEFLRGYQPLGGKPEGQVYIASPFFSLGDLWLVEEAARCLDAVGAKPFSPFHEIGFGEASEVAMADLEALRQSSAVLAIVSGADPGTLFEVGYAVSLGIPVVAVSQNGKPADATMLVGSGCTVTPDFTTGVYAAAWASRR